MDALGSFNHLNDRLPDWLARIETLLSLVENKREEFAADYVKVLAQARPKRRRTPSMTSLRANDESALAGVDANAPRDPSNMQLPTSEISPLEPENRYLFANARRSKRRQGTTMRSGASGLNSFRNQHHVIIYYDSSIQNSLETLVKEIGTARNNLRKGKQALELERGLLLNSFGVGTHGRRRRGPGPISPPEPKAKIPLTPPDEDASFTDVTNDLESAQALCETAAHQILRDGDCILELDRIRQALKNAQQIANTQITVLKPSETQKVVSELELPCPTSPSTTKALTSTPIPTTATISPSSKPTPSPSPKFDLFTPIQSKLHPSITPLPPNSASAEIEVDSEDETDNTDIVIDISRFRTQRGNGLRG